MGMSNINGCTKASAYQNLLETKYRWIESITDPLPMHSAGNNSVRHAWCLHITGVLHAWCLHTCIMLSINNNCIGNQEIM